jgi:Uncharacterized protein conserved in bacteria (DUF2171)
VLRKWLAQSQIDVIDPELGQEPLSPTERFSLVNEWRCNMFKSLDIQKDMEVVGDGNHVGIVDHLETADRIILSKDDPKAGGQQHLIGYCFDFELATDH